eukprot:TRINITY_DN4664_c0_g1_i2.p1 TRINITY_DN4664_c0_g1~~TRINITY_DN4664_c0_g1_i2.p1  ORF type:complete len:277 (-),score=-23.95 TRINITY_DN4664_c0_g1_i2:552-1382(-)
MALAMRQESGSHSQRFNQPVGMPPSRFCSNASKDGTGAPAQPVWQLQQSQPRVWGARSGEPVPADCVCPIPAMNWKESGGGGSSSSEASAVSVIPNSSSEVCPIAPQDWRALSRTTSGASERDTALSEFAVGGSPSRSPLHVSGPLPPVNGAPYGTEASSGDFSGVYSSSNVAQTTLREHLLRANSGTTSGILGPAIPRPVLNRLSNSCNNSRQSSGNFSHVSSAYSTARDSDETSSTGKVNWQGEDRNGRNGGKCEARFECSLPPPSVVSETRRQ